MAAIPYIENIDGTIPMLAPQPFYPKDLVSLVVLLALGQSASAWVVEELVALVWPVALYMGDLESSYLEWESNRSLPPKTERPFDACLEERQLGDLLEDMH